MVHAKNSTANGLKLSNQPRQAIRRVFRQYYALVVLGLAGVAYLSAAIGIWQSYTPEAAQSNADTITDVVYEAAQVLVLNMTPHTKEEYNFWIGVSRVCAVLLIALLGYKVISRLFEESMNLLCIRFSRAKQVVVAGLGRIGSQQALVHAQAGATVIAFEIVDPDHQARMVQDHGVIVLQQDVTDPETFANTISRVPTNVYLTTGDDLLNLNALVNLERFRQQLPKRNQLSADECDCFIHIEDPAMHRTLARCIRESDFERDTNLRIHPFNYYQEIAVQLIVTHLSKPALRPSKSEQVALYVIFGFDQMGWAMLKELAEFAHFENEKRSRILVVVPPLTGLPPQAAAEAAYQRCASQWARMTPRFVHDDLSQVDFDSAPDDWGCQKFRPTITETEAPAPDEVEYAANVHFVALQESRHISQAEALQLARLSGATEDNGTKDSMIKPAFLFCFERDEENFRLANELNDYWQDFEGINVPISRKTGNEHQHRRRQDFTIPLFTYLPLSSPLRETQLQRSCQPIPFGSVSEGLNRKRVQLIEDLAIDIAHSYDQSQNPSDTPPRDQYRFIWQQKPYWEQTSNRQAVIHVRVLMQLLGYEIVNTQTESGSHRINFEKFMPNEREMIARVEHNRWMAERLLLGWSYGEKSTQPPARPSMVPFDKLPDHEQKKDQLQIKSVLKFMNNREVLVTKLPAEATTPSSTVPHAG